MKYISTRGNSPEIEFEDAVIAGLAPDGGLYVPKEYPHFSQEKIASFKNLSYCQLVFEVIKPFVAGSIADDDLNRIINESYTSFRDSQIAPLVKIADNEYILELFHGPTMAFKDFALQLLGNLFDFILKKRNQFVTIIGATSGDTGSAAIEGCKNCNNLRIFILHPHQRISEVQRKQMTTVVSDNVFNIALQGSFDDCQDMVKAMFNNQNFLQGKTKAVAINSINWCRIMAQIVYYFYAGLKLGSPEKQISFSVPTGNFGDIFAGYIAKKMGLPIKQLIIATNSNDILHRFISNNDYSKGELVKTLAPSMDIQIASNFERLLFDIYKNDGNKIAQMMHDFRNNGLSVDSEKLEAIRETFASCKVDDETIVNMISDLSKETDIVIDPHTATGVFSARKCNADSKTPMITLATAHTAKFPDALDKAKVNHPPMPKEFAKLMHGQEKVTILPNDIDEVKSFISNNL